MQDPTGRIECTPDVPMLILERTLPASIEVVWAALTESDRTARWFGRWSGEPGVGNTVQVTWMAEEGAPTQPMTILACEPPRLLSLSSGPDEEYPWVTTVELWDDDGSTRLEFRQPMWGDIGPAMVGTGWEFYLDRLSQALAGEETLASWGDHYTIDLQPHYEELQAAMTLCS